MANLYSQLYPRKKIEKALKSADGISFSSGMITIKYQRAKQFFEPVIADITSHVKALLRDKRLEGLTYILIVGGFSECEFLQQAVIQNFQRNGTKVLIPSEAQLAIIKGAVVFGHKPHEVKERLLSKTYGCNVRDPFDEQKHEAHRKITDLDGVVRCRNIFERIIKKNTPVSVGQEVKRTFNARYAGCFRIKLFTTEKPPKEETEYIDDPGMTPIGSVAIDCKKAGKLELIMRFGSTELQVEAVDVNTGERSTTEIDFLS